MIKHPQYLIWKTLKLISFLLPAVKEPIKTFNSSFAEEIGTCSAGEKFLLHLYGGADCGSFDE